ncbi:MAG TPA: c-type cytochrome biogenesis protein CcsB [Nocardioidaceae bacterium]|jgi:cytochrome c-type biogenesis protein CcsB|nr:c-type cytochrome biogenesis protein CcsB [Nocardioidaceae bacterium]
MDLEQYASWSNLAMASATVILGLAWLAFVAEWAFTKVGAPRGERVLVGAGAPVAPAGAASGGDRSDAAARVGLTLTVLGTAVLLLGVLTRGLAAQRVPWGNMYEFATTGLLLGLLVYLVLVQVAQVQWLGIWVTGFAVVVLGLAFTVYVPAGPLVPALRSYWLVLHVSAAAIAGGAFLVGAGASALFLVKERAERRTAPDQRTGYLWRLPASAAMDRVAHRVHAFAFPIWTFAALIAGPIWAQYAWGRYWGWDPKEVWAFITWVVYAAYLHARATAGWRGRGAAILALVGFATFVFNFIGINLFADGLHSYAGV